MSGLIGKKIGMTSIYDANGKTFHVRSLKLVHV
jgi:ribosomal protein L3